MWFTTLYVNVLQLLKMYYFKCMSVCLYITFVFVYLLATLDGLLMIK